MTERKTSLPYPPPWQDTVTLAEHLCISPDTVPNWVEAGIIPAGRKRGGKWMWRWSEVDKQLADGKDAASPEDDDVKRVRDGTRAEANARH